MTATPRTLTISVIAIATLLIALIAPMAEAAPSDTGCDSRNFGSLSALTACVNSADAMAHLEAFQEIADDNGGTRASGTPGYDASVEYVAGLLEDAGYEIGLQEFDYALFQLDDASLTIDDVEPEYAVASYSGSGDIEGGNIVPVDLALGLGNASTSGCESTDFDGLDFGGTDDIALVQRGECSFAIKATNAQEAGAEGMLLFNQGNTADRSGVIFATLGGPGVDIPVIGIDYATGEELATTAADVDMSVDATIDIRTTANVIADLPGRNADNVVMAGAHLDSVTEGPGIQDNGSGSAAILAVALALGEANYTPTNSLRFAWWGAEESGLIGSTEYVFNEEFGLAADPDLVDYFALSMYLNFDMIASPNYYFGVYDADESTFDATAPVPPGSQAIEDVFEGFYTANDVPYEDSAFSGRSDYQAFIDVGIPAGGLFTGAEVLKTDEQAAIWGGVAGEQFDQCYHLACDTIDNVSVAALEVNIDAVATSIFTFAGSTESVNGVKGRSVGPTLKSYDGPQGTFAGDGGGAAVEHGHDHDHDLGEIE